MPQVKFERIVTYTSEDPNYPATNLLSNDPNKKWKCKSIGERQASVVFQLDQPYLINSIDIGNENSAYVEVLVARSSDPENYKGLLVMSSFMSPMEARQSQHVNKVRMFKQNDMMEPNRNEKWDRIKVVCTQPFKKHVQYGLSFINIQSIAPDPAPSTSTMTTIGKFGIRPESPDPFPVGSLFARRQREKESLKAATAIREATTLALSGSPVLKPKIKHDLISKAAKDKLKTDDNENVEETKNPWVEVMMAYDREEKEAKLEQAKIEEREERRRLEEYTRYMEATAEICRAESKDETPSKAVKRKSEDGLSGKKAVKKPKKITKPFEKLLEDVVIVISGIQNPDRASLRSMALSMGAKYKADWDDSCSHLICAFANTPKFHQVKGKGKIVGRKWLNHCYDQRKKIPWRRYALDRSEKSKDESEDEIFEEEEEADASDEELKEPYSDTDEQIEAIKATKNVYEADTDTEEPLRPDVENRVFKRKLETFFEGKMFFVDENFSTETSKKIKQYISAYNGVVADNLQSSTDFIVATKEKSEVLKDMCPFANCVGEDWIWECHNSQQLMPIDDFVY